MKGLTYNKCSNLCIRLTNRAEINHASSTPLIYFNSTTKYNFQSISQSHSLEAQKKSGGMCHFDFTWPEPLINQIILFGFGYYIRIQGETQFTTCVTNLVTDYLIPLSVRFGCCSIYFICFLILNIRRHFQHFWTFLNEASQRFYT